jgi:hypothetical protein
VHVIYGAVLMLLLVSGTASGQSLVLHGSAGPTITDSGHSLAAGMGFSPTSRLTVLLNVERTHVSSRFTSSNGRGNLTAAFRGGTVTFAAAELRATLLGRDRVSPYVFGGYGAGVSRPNINEIFPNRVSNSARVLFVGGGIHVPVRRRFSVFGDVRMVFGIEGNEGVLAFAPVRAGVAWRF